MSTKDEGSVSFTYWDRLRPPTPTLISTELLVGGELDRRQDTDANMRMQQEHLQ